jgi:branched-subunit amino acid ABC-type transport system permease component
MATTLNVIFAIALLVMAGSGLAITFGLMGVVNFAHGDFIMVGAFVAVVLSGSVPFALIVVIAGLAVAALSVPVERGLIRPLYRRPLDTILATYGLGLVLRELMRVIAGNDYRSVASPIDGTVAILGADYPTYRVVFIVVAVVTFAAMLVVMRRTALGTTVRAVIENPDLAAGQGVNVARTYTVAFATGGALAGIAGAFVSPLVSVYPDMGFDYIINAFLAVLIGGPGSVAGFGATGALMGGTDSLFDRFVDPVSGGIVVLVLAVALVRLRPNGLLGKWTAA